MKYDFKTPINVGDTFMGHPVVFSKPIEELSFADLKDFFPDNTTINLPTSEGVRSNSSYFMFSSGYYVTNDEELNEWKNKLKSYLGHSNGNVFIFNWAVSDNDKSYRSGFKKPYYRIMYDDLKYVEAYFYFLDDIEKFYSKNGEYVGD